MADVTTDINQTRAMRISQRRVEGFAQQFGEAHRNLARHAAFPLVLTPDLLYQIWANFVPEAPWTAVAHVLLSRLCRQVGYEMYEMDISDRNLLLRELKEKFGQERFDELGEFLLDYVAQRLTDDADTRDLREAQEWTALAYTKPAEVARELAQALSERMQQEDIGEVLRLASLVETLAEPLLGAGFEPLLVYSRGVDSLARSDQVLATFKLKKLLALNTSNFSIPKGILDAPSFSIPKGILDAPSFSIPKGILDVPSFSIPQRILYAPSFSIPKGILDATNLLIPKGILVDIKQQNDSIIPITSDLKTQHDFIHKLIKLIGSNSLLIESAIESDLSDKLSGETVTSDLIPDENNEGIIDEIEEIQEINLSLNNVKKYDNYFVIPFSLKVDCELTYFIYKADYYTMEDEESYISILDYDWNEHYFWVGEYYLLIVEGLVSVYPTLENINYQNISDDEAYEILENSQISIDSLTKIEIFDND